MYLIKIKTSTHSCFPMFEHMAEMTRWPSSCLSLDRCHWNRANGQTYQITTHRIQLLQIESCNKSKDG